MRRWKLPPQLTPTPTLAALAAAASVTAAADVAVVVPPEPALQQVRQPLPAGARADVALDVGGDGSGRLVFGTLRTDATLGAVALLDPQGRIVWRRTPAELGAVPRSQTSQPELGDAIPLPDVQQPAPGRWQLRLERAGPPALPAKLTLLYRVLPRHSLALWRATAQPVAGQPLLLTLKPTDMGRPVLQAQALALRVRPLQPGATADLQVRQDLAGPTGARISIEPGAYLAPWHPPQAGAYEIQASWHPPDAPMALIAVQRVDVAAAAGQLRFSGLKANGLPACVSELVLSFTVALDAPPAATAVHSLAIRLQGSRETRQLSTSVQWAGRGGSVELRVSHSTLQALGWPLQRIESSRLTRLSPDLQLLLTGEAVELAPLLPAAAPCR